MIKQIYFRNTKIVPESKIIKYKENQRDDSIEIGEEIDTKKIMESLNIHEYLKCLGLES